MIVTPLVVITIAAVARIADLRKLGELGIGMFIVFALLSALAASIMLSAALASGPGVWVGLSPPGYTPPTIHSRSHIRSHNFGFGGHFLCRRVA